MKISAIPIAAVERDTGIPKDTLRVWERRYRFPRPERDSKGERVYPADQVEQLRLLRRLLDQGHRPGSIVGAAQATLLALLEAAQPDTPPAPAAPHVAPMLGLIRQHRSAELYATLHQLLTKSGLQHFVSTVVAPLNEAIGDAWLRGQISVAEEHLYTEQVQNLLRSTISALSASAQPPRVLMTTVPGEEHVLGLLMAEAMLAPEGVQCTSLGVQTPLADIASSARAGAFDIVAVSFSAAFAARPAVAALEQLRALLDPRIALWAGGAALRHKRKAADGVIVLTSLTDIAPALAAWRAGPP
ncbi:MAG: MerR family transcriptional regulator [Rhodocyclaceae bacterium]|nr:MerR family transcriptional regulator [Rhodocyclaceae bacterium]